MGKQAEKQGFLRGLYGLFESNAVSYTLAALISLTSITACGGGQSNEDNPPINSPPVVYDIPDQETTSENCFSSISLDNYVYDPDNSDSEINWTFSGDDNLNVNITDRTASVCAKDSGWRGLETITFRATDPKGLFDSDPATFNVKNQGPTFSSIAPPTATENSEYQYDADASDPDGDTLTYSLIQAPNFMTIDSATGLIKWTPTDDDSNQSHNITIRAEDNYGDFAEQSFDVYVSNVENVSGNVKSFDSGSNLEGIQITLDKNGTTYSDITDTQGNWQLIDVLDGDYETILKDINASPIYETYKPRILRVSKEKNLEDKLTKDAKLFKIANRAIINDIGRLDPNKTIDIMRAWCPDETCIKPIWDIYTKEVNSETRVSQTLIDGVMNALKNEVSQFYQQQITDADINIIEGMPPLPSPQYDGHVYIYWDDNMQGINSSWLDGNKVVSGYVHFNTLNGKQFWLQELCEVIIGSGETQDSNYNDSIFHDPPYATSLSPEDLIASDMHFNPIYKRAIGNEDYNTDDNHDKDPDGSVWNQ